MPSIPYDANEKKSKNRKRINSSPDSNNREGESKFVVLKRTRKKTRYNKRNSNQRMMMRSPHPSRVIPAWKRIPSHFLFCLTPSDSPHGLVVKTEATNPGTKFRASRGVKVVIAASPIANVANRSVRGIRGRGSGSHGGLGVSVVLKRIWYIRLVLLQTI